jgi:cellulose synthase (UDP-forming)
VPAPDLIERMIGAFADDDVGVVQANQDFYNLDSFQHDTDWRRRDAWQQQELFFNVIQPGKDAFNAAFYCGSPAMLRRSALEQVGGFAHETITEDMHTSLRMHKRGLRSVYLNESVARGLAPQTFGGYASQWRRWGEGALQVFRAENPLFAPGLTPGQRLCYGASTFFYVTAWQKLLFLVMPAFCLFTGIFPLRTDARTYALFFGPYMLLNLWATALVQGGWRGFWRTEQFNLVKLTAQLQSVRGLWTRRREFSVTPKARAAAPAWTGLSLHLLVGALLASSVVVGVLHARSEATAQRAWAYGVTAAFAVYYLCMLVPVVRRALARREQRLTYRFPSHLDVRVAFRAPHAGVVREGEVFARNLNRFGLSLTLDYELPHGTLVELQLQLPDRVVHATAMARWSESFASSGRRRVANGLRFERIDVAEQDEIARFLFWEVVPAHGRMLRMTRDQQDLAREQGEAA